MSDLSKPEQAAALIAEALVKTREAAIATSAANASVYADCLQRVVGELERLHPLVKNWGWCFDPK